MKSVENSISCQTKAIEQGWMHRDTDLIEEPHVIVRKIMLNESVGLMEVKASLVAQKIRPGQFIMVRLKDKGERIPFTVYEKDHELGTITIIYQIVGKTTQDLNTLGVGDTILDVIGPLGNPSEIAKYGRVACIAGGVGAAELFPLVKALKNEGNYVIAILGFKSKDYVICEDKFRIHANELYITTDDGSYTRGLWGCEGFVSDALSNMLWHDKQANPYGDSFVNRVHAVGPVLMMKNICELTKQYGISTYVSLNPIMVDGTGMCGSCRVKIGKEMRLACVDGPEFDGHLVDFKFLMQRQGMFRQKEKQAADTRNPERSQ